ncbi:hypothetical protein RND81_05G096400 [Saponaria officinalis]|uniref:Uncharacterized protein n=1 Tax=Saponaria officinalis TaxID=3572 RepID=A0AAW1KVS6_SAPOF
MSTNNTNISAFNLRSVLEKDKLNVENFPEWERNLRIVLRSEGKEAVLDNPLLEPLAPTATAAEKRARQPTLDTSVHVTCLMLALLQLERFEAHRKLLECKLAKGKPVGLHVSNTTLQELHGMLIQAVKNLSNEPEREHKDVLLVRKGKSFKKVGAGPYSKKDKGKEVVKYASLGKTKANPKPKVAAEHENCTKYLEDKKNGASISGIFVIEVNLATYASWVFDTGCGTHIICYVQGLKRSRILEKEEVDLRVGNGQEA